MLHSDAHNSVNALELPGASLRTSPGSCPWISQAALDPTRFIVTFGSVRVIDTPSFQKTNLSQSSDNASSYQVRKVSMLSS